MRNRHAFRRGRWIGLAVVAGVTLAGWNLRAADICGDRIFAKDMLDALVKAYDEEKNPKDKIRVSCRWTDYDNVIAFGRGESEAMLTVGPLFDGAVGIIAQRSPSGNLTKWEKLEIGQVRVLAIANASNKLSGLTLEQIQKLLAAKTGPGMTWKDLGGEGGLVTCYGEHEESTSRMILRDRVMRFTNRKDPDSLRVSYSGFFAFRDNFALCGDAQEVIDEVARDRNGIGFITFTGQLPKEVRALPLAEKPDAAFVAPRLEPTAQKEYPLGTPILLHVHPLASQTTQDFARWAASPAGAKEFLATISGYDSSAASPGRGPRRNLPTSQPATPTSQPSRPTGAADPAS